MKITFVTGNPRKLGEAKEACKPFGIEVGQTKLDIHEIQHHNPIQISKHKANEAYDLIKTPLVINDATWKIPALNGFPGGYMKDVAEWFSPEDFIALMKNKRDKRLCCVETVIYKDKNVEKIFHREFWGEVSNNPKGSGNSIEQIAKFNGKTIGEHRDQGRFAFDAKDYIWHDFAKWYSESSH
ncbi:MAG: non-canonical purine NTP pyrophosphatase [Candidatus Saccharibacteria bacterium]|nr:non-canonical purine NTP pyrophosphatase [Candidatus Saccharibacteria bacterium]